MQFLPAADIAAYVGEGNVDMGITGEDIVAESEMDVNVVRADATLCMCAHMCHL